VPVKAPEVAKKREQVALKAVEVAILPVPVALTKRRKRKNPPRVGEANLPTRGLRVSTHFK
jgi:hypothetical protein